MLKVYNVRAPFDPPNIPEWVIETPAGRLYEASPTGQRRASQMDYGFVELGPAVLAAVITPPPYSHRHGTCLRELIAVCADLVADQSQNREVALIEAAAARQFGTSISESSRAVLGGDVLEQSFGAEDDRERPSDG